MYTAPARDTNTRDLKDASKKDAGESLTDAAYNAGQKMRGMLDNAGDELSHASEYVGTEIRTNPIRSSLIALGAGVLLGMLLRK